MGILRETIRPSSDLRNKYPEISKTLQLKDEAAIITVNGVTLWNPNPTQSFLLKSSIKSYINKYFI